MGQSIEVLSSDAGELQLSIMHLLVRALTKLPGEESAGKAWNIMSELEADSANRLPVLLLKLDLYALDQTSSAQDYCDVLSRILRTIHLTDINLKTTLHHVHKLRLRSPRMAHTSLECLLSERLAGAEEPAWMERTLITMIWNCTSSTDFTDADAQALIRDVLEKHFTHTRQEIGPSATHAAQIVSIGF